MSQTPVRMLVDKYPDGEYRTRDTFPADGTLSDVTIVYDLLARKYFLEGKFEPVEDAALTPSA